MQARRRIALAALALLGGILSLFGGGALVACFDVFHSTSDVVTACESDPARPGCGPVVPDAQATADVETDFCAWSPHEAQQHALHACTWLGACETPMGNNAFGPCYFRALLAYDCAANPNHRARHAAHGLWDCLQRVKTCADVDACIFPDARPACSPPGLYTACATIGPGTDVRVLCDADGGAGPPYPKAGGENCALWGKTCATTDGGSVCAGSAAGACTRGCDGTALRWCDPADDGGPGFDQGLDCASNGASACAAFPDPDAAQWYACRGDSDAAACTPDASATCDNGRATFCLSGVPETLDCAALFGTANACAAGPLAAPFDWTSPCTLGGSCAADSCDGTMLTSCERGAGFSVSCMSEGLGDCRLTTVDPASGPRAACGPPLP